MGTKPPPPHGHLEALSFSTVAMSGPNRSSGQLLTCLLHFARSPGCPLASPVYITGLSPCWYHGDLPEVIWGVACPLVQAPDPLHSPACLQPMTLRQEQPKQAGGSSHSGDQPVQTLTTPVGSFHYFWQLSGQRAPLALTQNLFPKPESPPCFPHTPLVLPVPGVLSRPMISFLDSQH